MVIDISPSGTAGGITICTRSSVLGNLALRIGLSLVIFFLEPLAIKLVNDSKYENVNRSYS